MYTVWKWIQKHHFTLLVNLTVMSRVFNQRVDLFPWVLTCVYCVLQEEGVVRGVREQSWNEHQDAENHSGIFSEKLIRPIKEEWGNSHCSVCNLFLLPSGTSGDSHTRTHTASHTQPHTHTHTERERTHMLWVQKLSKQMSTIPTWFPSCYDVATCGTKANEPKNIL